MCTSFLFTPSGGAIAWFGATQLTYTSDDLNLASGILSCDTLPGLERPDIGTLIRQGKQRFAASWSYLLLGDPAIVPAKYRRTMTYRTIIDSTGLFVKCGFNSQGLQSGEYRLRITIPEKRCAVLDPAKTYTRNVEVYDTAGSFSDYIFVIPLPQWLDTAYRGSPLGCEMYIRNGYNESRKSFLFREPVPVLPGAAQRPRNGVPVSVTVRDGRIRVSRTFGTEPVTVKLFDLSGKQRACFVLDGSVAAMTVDARSSDFPARMALVGVSTSGAAHVLPLVNLSR